MAPKSQGTRIPYASSSSANIETSSVYIRKDKFPTVLSSSVLPKVGFSLLFHHSQGTEGMTWIFILDIQSSRVDPYTDSWLPYNIDSTVDWGKAPFVRLLKHGSFNTLGYPQKHALGAHPLPLRWIQPSAHLHSLFFPLGFPISHTIQTQLYSQTPFLMWLSSTCFSQLSLKFLFQLWFYPLQTQCQNILHATLSTVLVIFLLLR